MAKIEAGVGLIGEGVGVIVIVRDTVIERIAISSD
jgi:hypothetical protein